MYRGVCKLLIERNFQDVAMSKSIFPHGVSLVLLILFQLVSLAHAELLFRMHGSNTVGASLAPALAEAFLRDELGARRVTFQPASQPQEGAVIAELVGGKQVQIEIQAHGSSTGFRSMKAGQADIAMSSRPIKEKEFKALLADGKLDKEEAEHVIGLDGIAVIVAPGNPVKKLGIDQLAAIYSGKIRNWKAVGGKPGAIHVYARDDNSGTYDTFKSLVLGKKHKLIANARRYESNARLSDEVAADPHAIGFVGLPYVRQSHALIISAGEGARAPSEFNVATEDYALSRRLFMYASITDNLPEIKKFLDYIDSRKGQEVVRKVGFISQNLQALDVRVTKNYPQEYRQFVKQARRLSVNFRFRKTTLEPDSRAVRDLDRVAQYIRKHDIKEVMLFGFSEDARIPIYNISLSESRADLIERELHKRGVVVNHIRGYGAVDSVAGNEDKSKNRRVEVWVR